MSRDPGHECTAALTVLATANPLTTQGQPTSEQLLGLDARRKRRLMQQLTLRNVPQGALQKTLSPPVCVGYGTIQWQKPQFQHENRTKSRPGEFTGRVAEVSITQAVYDRNAWPTRILCTKLEGNKDLREM